MGFLFQGEKPGMCKTLSYPKHNVILFSYSKFPQFTHFTRERMEKANELKNQE